MGSPKPNTQVNNLGYGVGNQQQALNQNIMGGLQASQGRSDQVFNAMFGGYNRLLGEQQAGGGGNGARVNGGGGAGMQAPASIGANTGYIDQNQQLINALQGPQYGANPWEGALGQNIRARDASLTPAFYDRIRSEQERLQNVQGGYNPGFTAQLAKIAREQSQAAQKGQLEANIDLGSKGAAFNDRSREAEYAAQVMRQEKLLQTGQMKAAAQNAAARANAAMGMQFANAQARARAAAAAGDQQTFRNQMAILDAMGGLRGQAPGEVGMYLSGGLNNIGRGNENLQLMQGYNQPRQSGLMNILGSVIPAAGMAAGAIFGPKPTGR